MPGTELDPIGSRLRSWRQKRNMTLDDIVPGVGPDLRIDRVPTRVGESTSIELLPPSSC